MTSTTTSIPLFPLDLVLFPGADLPLHIFEERYKRMMNLCLRENRDFGVVLARADAGVPGQCIPYEVGTTAHIRGATRMPDGRMNIVTTGMRRFQIVACNWEMEYCTGEVRWLPDDEEGDDALARRAATRWNAFRGKIATLTEEEWEAQEFAGNPAETAYSLAASLPVSNEEKQRLLEATDTDVRLREVVRLVGREHGLLDFLSVPHTDIPEPPEGSTIYPN